jgi:hypothetical protein
VTVGDFVENVGVNEVDPDGLSLIRSNNVGSKLLELLGCMDGTVDTTDDMVAVLGR